MQVDAVADAYASLSQKKHMPTIAGSLASAAIGRTNNLPF